MIVAAFESLKLDFGNYPITKSAYVVRVSLQGRCRSTLKNCFKIKPSRSENNLPEQILHDEEI